MLVAFFSTAGRLLLPHADRLQPRIVKLLEAELDSNVHIGRVSAAWPGYQPYLKLDNIVIGSQDGGLQFEQVRLQINPLNVFKPGSNAARLTVVDAQLEVVRDAQDNWQLAGLGSSNQMLAETDEASEFALEDLLSRTDLQLINSRLSLHDELHDTEYNIRVPWLSLSQVPDPAGSTARPTVLQSAGNRWREFNSAQQTFKVQARLLPRVESEAGLDVQLYLGINTGLEQLHGYAHLDRQALSPWVRLIQASGKVGDESMGAVRVAAMGAGDISLAWQSETSLSLSGDIAVDLEDPTAKNLQLATSLNAEMSDSNWLVELSELQVGQLQSNVWLQVGSNGAGGLSMASSAMDLSLLNPLLEWQSQWLIQQTGISELFTITGEMLPVDLALDADNNVIDGAVQVQNVYLEFPAAASQSLAFCGPLQVAVEMHKQLGQAVLSSQEGSCVLPGLTAQPYLLNQLSSRSTIEQNSAGWLFNLHPSHLDLEDLTLDWQGLLVFDSSGSYIDVSLGFDQLLAVQLHEYFPAAEQPSNAQRWIQRALKSGYLRNGKVAARGYLSDWPLLGANGQFISSFDLENVEMDYARNWPVADRLNARVFVDAEQLSTANASARLRGGDISGLNVRIEELSGDATLYLTADLKDNAHDILDLVGELPITRDGGFSEREYDLQGPVTVRPNIAIRLNKSSDIIYANGYAELNDVTASADPIVIDSINGRLVFDDIGLANSEMTARWGIYPATLRWVRTEQGSEVQLQGDFSMQQVANAALQQPDVIEPLVSGSSNWLLQLLIERDEPEAVLSSNLRGTELRLPPPLAKFASEVQPLTVRVPMSDGQRILSVDYGSADIQSEQPNVMLRIMQDVNRITQGIRLHLNASSEKSFSLLQTVTPDVETGKLLVTGTTDALDPMSWLAVQEALSASPTEPEFSAASGELQAQVDLQIEQLLLDKRVMGRTHVLYRQEETLLMGGEESIRQTPDLEHILNLTGENLDGEVRAIENGNDVLINADLKALHIPAPPDLPGGLTEPVFAREQDTVDDGDRVDWLTVHLVCDDFSIHGYKLGQTRIELLPTTNGITLDTLESRSDAAVIVGHGGWERTEGGVFSTFDVRLDTDNMGDMFAAFGYDRLVEDAQATIELDVWWPGSTSEFSLESFAGDITINAVNGSIPAADPGAGKALGLISLQALPRRLFLDFSDLTTEGLEFDSAEGRIEFANGIATTEGIEIDAVAADISITGSTDLIAQRYNQQIEIQPGLGLALPVAGAIVGGPIGAGAGLVVQALLGNTVGKATRFRYEITGPWSDPEFRAFSDEPTVLMPEDERVLQPVPQPAPDSESG